MFDLDILTEGELAFCRMFAATKTAASRIKQTHRPFDMGSKEHFDNEEAGVIGEYAFCKTHNIFFDGRFAGRDGGYDCVLKGLKIDIKSTTRSDGNLLAWTGADHTNVDVFVLVYVIDYVPSIRGWVLAKNFIQERHIKEMKHGPCYFMDKDVLLPWKGVEDE